MQVSNWIPTADVPLFLSELSCWISCTVIAVQWIGYSTSERRLFLAGTNKRMLVISWIIMNMWCAHFWELNQAQPRVPFSLSLWKVTSNVLIRHLMYMKSPCIAHLFIGCFKSILCLHTGLIVSILSGVLWRFEQHLDSPKLKCGRG